MQCAEQLDFKLVQPDMNVDASLFTTQQTVVTLRAFCVIDMLRDCSPQNSEIKPHHGVLVELRHSGQVHRERVDTCLFAVCCHTQRRGFSVLKAASVTSP
jgi:hypothetical protein